MVMHKSIFKKIPTFLLASLLSLSLIFPSSLLAQAQSIGDANNDDNVFLYVGDLITVKVKGLTRVAIASAGVVDITNVTTDEITLVGRKVGQTQIFIWENGIKRLIMARVLSTDLDLVASRIASLIQSVGIKGLSVTKNYYEGKLIITGSLNKNEKKKFQEIVKDFSGSIIDLVVEEGDLIQIDVQFSELDTTLTKALGFDWTTGGSLAFQFSESLPTQDGSFADLFKIGDFARTSAILSVVNLLISEGRARILSKPSLVVTNGESASFLVGGEIPIRTTTSSSGGSTQENITFKSYGVDLTVKPEIRDGKIDIDVSVVVRDVDNSLVVSAGVAFLTRNATTKVRVSDEQTIVLAGMIQRRNSEDTKRVPYLSKIPVIGLLFKSTNTPNVEKELVVSLTPRILKKIASSTNQETQKIDTASGKIVNKTPEISAPVENVKTQKDIVKPAVAKMSESASDSPKPETIEAPKNIIKPVLLTPAQQKAAEKKARAKAKADKARIKKENVQRLKQEKAEKERAAREERAKKNPKKQKTIENKPAVKKEKLTKEKQTKEKQTPEKKTKEKQTLEKQTKEKQAKVQDSQLKMENTKPSVDPSLNMALEDVSLQEPQNILTDQEILALKEKYKTIVATEMAQSISYPYQAKESHWEGTAVLNITILPDGSVKDVAVTQSSGYSIFDKDAVNTAEILSPYEAFLPAKNLRELSISVAVDYSEKAILGIQDMDKK